MCCGRTSRRGSGRRHRVAGQPVAAGAGPEALVGGRDGYRVGTVDTDLDRARMLLDDAVRQPPALAAVAARSAARLLEVGPALPEEADAEWVAAVRADVAAVLWRGPGTPSPPRHWATATPTAEDAARRALADDPLDEEAAGLLLRALLDRGLPAEALRVYEQLRHDLADELGADPAPATRALHAAALAGAVPAPRRRQPRRRPTGPVWSAGTTSSAGCAPRSNGPAVGRPGWAGPRRGNRGSARAGCWRSWPRWPGAPTPPCSAAGPSRGSARSSPSPWSTRSPRWWAAVRRRRSAGPAAGAPVLGRLVPDIAPFADPVPAGSSPRPPRKQAQSFAAVAHVLRGLAREHPVLVIVDDLQRAGRVHRRAAAPPGPAPDR